MRKVAKTVFPLLFILISAGCEQFTNPYDYKCPPEIWSPAKLNALIQNREILLTWEESATHFDGFMLERSSDSINWVAVNQALIDKTARSYTDTVNLHGSLWFYRIFARADKNQSNYSYSAAVCLPPAKPDTISGPDYYPQFARDLIYTILPVTGATSYIWTIPEGATLVSGQGTHRMVMHAGSKSGNVEVVAVNACGNSAPQKLTITVCQLPGKPEKISGPTTVRSQSEDNLYSVSPVQGAESYQWQVPPGATINYGQGTTKISVDFGDSNGYITVCSVNTCGRSESDSIAITIAASGICNQNTFNDFRYDKTYRHQLIADQEWMADNLARGDKQHILTDISFPACICFEYFILLRPHFKKCLI